MLDSPMSDNGEIDPKQQHFRWLEEILKHSKAKRATKLFDLAARLRIWRMVQTNSSEFSELAKDPLLARILTGIAREFQQALVVGRGDFFRDVAQSSDELEKEKHDFFEKYNIQTQALLIHEELWGETGQQPTLNKVLKRLEEVLKTTLSERQRRRVRQTLAQLRE